MGAGTKQEVRITTPKLLGALKPHSVVSTKGTQGLRMPWLSTEFPGSAFPIPGLLVLQGGMTQTADPENPQAPSFC